MFKEFYTISSYPAINSDATFRNKLILLLKLYGIVLVINVFTAPLVLLLELLVKYLHYKSPLMQYKTSFQHFFSRYGYLKAVAYVSVIGPIIEESIFRLPLSFKRKNIAVAFGFALLFMAKLIPGLAQQSLLVNIAIRVLLFIGGYFLLVIFLPANTTPVKKTQNILIVTSVIVFGLLHMFNYLPFQIGILYLYPLYVLPQLFMGWVLTYVRFKNGFAWGIALHILINSFAMMVQTIYTYKLHRLPKLSAIIGL